MAHLERWAKKYEEAYLGSDRSARFRCLGARHCGRLLGRAPVVRRGGSAFFLLLVGDSRDTHSFPRGDLRTIRSSAESVCRLRPVFGRWSYSRLCGDDRCLGDAWAMVRRV
jgi:hypothetical protein